MKETLCEECNIPLFEDEQVICEMCEENIKETL